MAEASQNVQKDDVWQQAVDVFYGKDAKKDERYRYCSRITFCHYNPKSQHIKRKNGWRECSRDFNSGEFKWYREINKVIKLDGRISLDQMLALRCAAQNNMNHLLKIKNNPDAARSKLFRMIMDLDDSDVTANMDSKIDLNKEKLRMEVKIVKYRSSQTSSAGKPIESYPVMNSKKGNELNRFTSQTDGMKSFFDTWDYFISNIEKGLDRCIKSIDKMIPDMMEDVKKDEQDTDLCVDDSLGIESPLLPFPQQKY